MEEIIDIPKEVTVKLQGDEVTVVGKVGQVKKVLSDPNVNLEVKGSKFHISAVLESRKQKRVIQTFKAEMLNMFKSASKGCTYKMKIIFVHFPITVKAEKEKAKIENFLGERFPRFAKLFPGVTMTVNKQDIELKGADHYAVSQSAANIERACSVGRKDRRVFQDGIYITSKDSE